MTSRTVSGIAGSRPWECLTCPLVGNGRQTAEAHAAEENHRVTVHEAQTVTIGPRRPWAPHETCHHRIYELTCAEYDALLARANEACEICTRRGRLVIDHDHQTGVMRGLLCMPCNRQLGMVDSGQSVPTPKQSAYLSQITGSLS